ncbi:hypothetical protein K469DRAFT_724083 [Zopfia rhizophila CBS 207.26]|uniref:DNA-directed RNA polymerase I subunit RPA34.5-domain-containing protein n=1 Tax=Zopfia rhizophila CBS 207.26 TaxID=1314779 RepID=A0A6A6D929_9PEZI|nr:hypothetical protein K469DRAFT_724083 [Zopfia rhizophila CBS 207.26]
MKKARVTPVPLPGSTPKIKSHPSQKFSKSQLSAEFVDSSDYSANEETLREKSTETKSKHKSPIKIGVHRPKTNGVSSKPQKSPNRNTPAKEAVIEENSGTSSQEENDDDSNKSVDYTQRQSESEGSEEDESDSRSRSSSGSSSEDNDEEEAEQPSQSTGEDQTRTPQPHTVEFRAPQPFDPPKGFTAVSAYPSATSNALKLFGNLKGKQIWHITAPAGVPITTLKEVTLGKAKDVEVALNHKGIDYGFIAGGNNEEAMRNVLIPGPKGYKAVCAPISRTIHLQQVIRLPNISPKQAAQNAGSSAAALITSSTIRAPRPQVKGLRMRYFPSGFGDQDPGVLGSSDSENEVSGTTGVGVPNGAHSAQKAEKRRYEEMNGAEKSSTAKKKHKKSKDPEEIKRREEKAARKERKKQKELAR